ncbi:MAG: hypothetical protein Q4A27_02110 [bacterium]|nr:hypothetical protein [bacterium]
MQYNQTKGGMNINFAKKYTVDGNRNNSFPQQKIIQQIAEATEGRKYPRPLGHN